ncbi:MFS transporter [Acinetobacter oleivorans]|uniref:MFS transporter n=1 Tax=Acinetobacter oleivorans TaxID=1148157 RepID=UPI001CD732F8|nr:MFS transporter [Acinetobacter oleivorans]
MTSSFSQVNPDRKSKVRAIAGISLGNALEYFDFTLFTFFAIYIGNMAFPKQSATSQLLFTFGIYGLGFISRPLGAWFLGRLADTKGRKHTINLILILMALGTCLIGLTPSYEQIGIFSPLLILLGRLIQGFSAGGETGTSTTLLAEIAPPKKRNFYVSFQGTSQGLAVLLASVVVLCLNLSLTPEQMHSWGWRIPFFIGLIIVPVGFYLRKTLDETLETPHPVAKVENNFVEKDNVVAKTSWKKFIPQAIQGVLLVLSMNAGYTIIQLYMPTYGVQQLHLSPAISTGAVLVGSIVVLIFVPFGGLLCDRFGSKRMLIISRVLGICLIYPTFLWINNQPSMFTLLSGIAFLSLIGAMAGASVFTILTELFPRYCRVTAMSLVYSISVTIGAGFSQFIVTYLIKVTHNPLSPALYLVAIGILSLLALLTIKDKTGLALD